MSLSMEKHKCKLCSKKFLSGKTLGGHVRSHLIPLPLPPKSTPPLNQDSGSRSESTLSLCSSENQQHLLEHMDFYYGLRENPKKSFRMIDPEFYESETESERNPSNRKRFKGSPNKEKAADFVSLSLYSDEKDIAMCLMMLSRDVWKNSKLNQCEICHRIFKTSQALGSHRTIHKIKNCNNYEHEARKNSSKRKLASVKNAQKLHECPFCGKKFQSGQALGGHKRSHFVTMSTSTTGSSSSTTKFGDYSLMEYSNSADFPNGYIDLNMPAPMEDNDFSQVEFQQEQEFA
ncbi:putative DNA-directed RNA polymerase III subunit RPC5-like isoform X1 [Capsicum annuum]|uniref:zinc finger protein ZAT1-like n=1 Tax=Capsicum annuum TaxID=4072 RepID=UPI001FB18BAF|nr:zinc finger protein ZAT1-like [Capsicum annuum]KAF3666938.1 putative DNA-directed RNA polymerase III subunit RPC5-like isoform X1 [Capsicum annuum]